MSSLLVQVLKAMLRIEKKLDEVLKLQMKSSRLTSGPTNPLAHHLEPMDYRTQSACPLCQRQVVYQPVEFQDHPGIVVIRLCGCKPQTMQLPIKGEEL